MSATKTAIATLPTRIDLTRVVTRAGYRAALPSQAMVAESGLNQCIDRIFAAFPGSLRKLIRPAVVLALGLTPALCFTAALDFSGAATRSGRSAPFRILLFLQAEHIGKLKPDLTPSQTAQTERLLPATPEERSALPIQLSDADRVFTGSTFLPKSKKLKLALVEPAQGNPYLFADINLNDAFEAGERFSFTATKNRLLPYPEVVLDVRVASGPFSVYPVRLLLPEARIYTMNRDGKGGRYLLRSPFDYVQGTVEIGGKPVLAAYMFDPDKGNAYPDYGWLGMDTNGDGSIDESGKSDEHTFAKDETVIFHVNGRDVSTVSIDLKSGTFVVREHPPGDNNRIPLKVGETLPDFAFTDADNKPHKLSDYWGKFVLLDFWGTWCSPCVSELPNLEKAWQHFRSRGFVILGIDDDDDAAKAQKLLTEKGVTFPQAGGPSGRELVEKRFRIEAFPTLVLLDPAGKVVSLDEKDLRFGQLEATLDKLLPAAR